MMARLLAIAAAVLCAGCSTVVAGQAVSIYADPFRVAGMPAVDGESGLRPGAPGPTRVVIGTDDGEVDEFARNAASDIEEFWEGAYGEAFDGSFTPVESLQSWDSSGVNTVFCGEDTLGVVNAGYCPSEHTIGWDRGELLPSLREANGDMAVVAMLAHEYGHAVQGEAGIATDDTSVLVGEQQADCLAGVYMRWVAEGSSPRFTLSTGDGLNGVLAAVIALADPVANESDPEAGVDPHGSAFERISAFQFGFTDGAESCAAIDEQEVEQRRGDLPVLLPDDETGELDLTEDSLRQVVDAMSAAFALNEPPALAFAPIDCPDSRSSDPAVYCPSDNTVAVDLPALRELSDESADYGLSAGDNTGYSVVLSRYLLALERERGVRLDDAQAALRTACLTGVATARMAEGITTPDGRTIQINAGDLDEAVAGLLVNGYAASDVNGDTVPSGFSRIDAFRIGVLGNSGHCFGRFA